METNKLQESETEIVNRLPDAPLENPEDKNRNIGNHVCGPDFPDSAPGIGGAALISCGIIYIGLIEKISRNYEEKVYAKIPSALHSHLLKQRKVPVQVGKNDAISEHYPEKGYHVAFLFH